MKNQIIFLTLAIILAPAAMKGAQQSNQEHLLSIGWISKKSGIANVRAQARKEVARVRHSKKAVPAQLAKIEGPLPGAPKKDIPQPEHAAPQQNQPTQVDLKAAAAQQTPSSEKLPEDLQNKQGWEDYITKLKLIEAVAKIACTEGNCRRCARVTINGLFRAKDTSGKKPSDAAHLFASIQKTKAEDANDANMEWLRKSVYVTANDSELMKVGTYTAEHFPHPYLRHLVTLASWTIKGHAQSLNLPVCQMHQEEDRKQQAEKLKAKLNQRAATQNADEAEETQPTLAICVSPPPQESPKAA